MSNIVRTNPLGDLVQFDPFRDFEDFFGTRRMPSFMRGVAEPPEIKMDVRENDQAYQIKAEIPGVRKEDIRVAIDGNSVSITAEVKREKEEKKGETVLRSERYYGSQSRRFALAREVDQARAEAKYQDGILELTLPKRGGTSVKELTVQ